MVQLVFVQDPGCVIVRVFWVGKTTQAFDDLIWVSELLLLPLEVEVVITIFDCSRDTILARFQPYVRRHRRGEHIVRMFEAEWVL
jgi:hypothetical protein